MKRIIMIIVLLSACGTSPTSPTQQTGVVDWNQIAPGCAPKLPLPVQFGEPKTKPTRYADGTIFGRPDLKNIVMGIYPTLQHGNVLVLFLPVGENYHICAWGAL